ncbi:hypothetical protein THAOC_29263 [Thalassiosira oceanica]|uniref:B30.2/SPRY domain-containing protein n=1 Tax=Thalassiosira oceanica TaxID=159749 RepID=K0RGY1_THAOC|nr:hypothetical protein THAOC_29263 [Thalassiosira oceanica]|eukprot:EJK51554.1 hypothetical protein THAOC_29263 [Thalassiosira oceanica]
MEPRNKRARLPSAALDVLGNDLLVRCASYLDADGLAQLGRTSARFGIPQAGQQRSFANEAARQRFLEGATDEERSRLPEYDDESDVGLLRALELSRKPLCFDELVGPAVSEKLRSQRTEKWGESNAHCCAYKCSSGRCLWTDWDNGQEFDWQGQEGLPRSGTIGLLLDLDEGTLSVFKDGRRLGVMKEGLVYFPYAIPRSNSVRAMFWDRPAVLFPWAASCPPQKLPLKSRRHQNYAGSPRLKTGRTSARRNRINVLLELVAAGGRAPPEGEDGGPSPRHLD